MAKDRSKEILKEVRSLREELTSRLDALEARLAGAPPAAPPISAVPDSTPDPIPLPVGDQATARNNDSFELPTSGEVRVIVRPLHDLSLARVVEDALANTEGVEEASLRELRGDSATIDTKVGDGVSLISSLRRKLPVAFDVTESSKDSVTIALAQPMGGRESGVAAPTGL
ncbi:MAG: hypothetical protein J0H98_05240 [Solirubrobacterales bacterium]|nr:hypothetical protein [Solirubrobacterales bacterium]